MYFIFRDDKNMKQRSLPLPLPKEISSMFEGIIFDMKITVFMINLLIVERRNARPTLLLKIANVRNKIVW